MRRLCYVICMLVIVLACFFSCDAKQEDISVSFNNEYAKKLENNSCELGQINLNSDEDMLAKDIPFVIYNKDEVLLQNVYSVKYYILEGETKKEINASDKLQDANYVLDVTYKNYEFSLNLKVNKEERRLSINVNKTALEWGEEPVNCFSDEKDIEYRYIESYEYEALEDKSVNSLKEASTVYNKDNLDAGSYYVFAVKNVIKDQTKGLSNLIKIVVSRANDIQFSIAEGGGFEVSGGIEYREGILLDEIEFTTNGVSVVDKNGDVVLGQFRWKNGNEIIDCTTKGAYLEFIPTNKNYAVLEKYIEFNNLIVPQVVSAPIFVQADAPTYNGQEFGAQIEDAQDSHLYNIFRDKKIININDGDNILEKIKDAKEYTYEIVLKDPRNYVFEGTNSTKVEYKYSIKPAPSYVQPDEITVYLDENNNASIKVSTNNEENTLQVSKYLPTTLKCYKEKDQDGSCDVEKIDIKANIDEKCNYITFTNITLTGSGTHALKVKVSARGLNFKDFEKVITVYFERL